MVDKTGVRVQIPVGGLACLMLEPGIRITHAAVALAAKVGCLLVWVGEAGVRLYSAGQPGGARADRLLHQAQAALDPVARLRVIRAMYRMRFGEEPPLRRSPEQLRGMEGARVRRMYEQLASVYGFTWTARHYNPDSWDSADVPNRCLSAGTSCLYGLCEAAVLRVRMAIKVPSPRQALELRLRHRDLFKFETVVPLPSRARAAMSGELRRPIDGNCAWPRDAFRRTDC